MVMEKVGTLWVVGVSGCQAKHQLKPFANYLNISNAWGFTSVFSGCQFSFSLILSFFIVIPAKGCPLY